ncbi:hypothetical protein [uncultured Marinobacter sp.]|uniref:hypothetical protein n=1 Tax=uncultured Marinobacter sp. TaxID=187379 RepID=UPI0030DCECA5
MPSRLGSLFTHHQLSPVVITDASWYRLADDMAVALASSRRSLIWLNAPRGAGKSAWLQALLPSLRTDFCLLNLRAAADVQEVLERFGGHSELIHGPAPALILDNLSPAELMSLLAEPDHPARHLVPDHSGPIMLLSPETDGDAIAARRLERVTGRSLVRHDLPASSMGQNQAVLVAHQAAIEKRWQVQITDEAMEFAVAGLRYRAMPGQVVEWMERAAARVAVVAEEGPRECRRLRAEIQTLEKRIKTARKRDLPTEDMIRTRDELSLELTAAEIDWLERQSDGTLTQVLPTDLREELESLTGKGDYPDLPLSSTLLSGEDLSERSGNLRA